PPAEITSFVQTVRELSPVLERNGPAQVPFPDEWPDTFRDRVRDAFSGALQFGAAFAKRITNPPAAAPSAPVDQHTDPRLSARQPKMDHGLLGGVVAPEDADAIQQEILRFVELVEVNALKRYFNGPHEPWKNHCRFCGDMTGFDRCRRPGLPH